MEWEGGIRRFRWRTPSLLMCRQFDFDMVLRMCRAAPRRPVDGRRIRDDRKTSLHQAAVMHDRQQLDRGSYEPVSL